MNRRTKKDWFVYIAQAKTGRLYVGISTNPQERVEEHNSKKGARFARLQGPFQLVYQTLQPSKSAAVLREQQIKGWRQGKKLKLISGEWK